MQQLSRSCHFGGKFDVALKKYIMNLWSVGLVMGGFFAHPEKWGALGSITISFGPRKKHHRVLK